MPMRGTLRNSAASTIPLQGPSNLPMNASTALAMTSGDGSSAAKHDIDDVRLAAGGDVAAFERLYRRHVDRVHSLVSRMLDPDMADEVTQDVFVRVWGKLGTFRGESTFGTWLHRVTVNLVLGRRKKLGIRRERYHPNAEAVLDRTSAAETRTAMGAEFEAGMRRLPPRARDVFVLHDVEGFKHREIAELLGVTAGTTKAQLHRARMLMREYLSR
jgi:RNA polymerase sigma-70 factor (ECF subfamily)